MQPLSRRDRRQSREGPADQAYLDRLEGVSFQPVFIMGDHRSGTTLLYKLLSSLDVFNYLSAYDIIHYDQLLANHVQGREEEARRELAAEMAASCAGDRVIDRVEVTPGLPEEYGFVLKNHGFAPRLTAANLPFFEQICRKLQFVAENDRPLLLKNPWDFGNFTAVMRRFPQAKLVFLHRNPLEVINSKLKAVRAALGGYLPYLGMLSQDYVRLYRQPTRLALMRMLFSPRWKVGVRVLTRESARLTDYYFAHIGEVPPDSYVSVTYESICQAPRESLQTILTFLNTPPVDLDACVDSIDPRPVQLLPEVARFEPVVRRKLQRYFEFLQQCRLAPSLN